MCVRIFAIFILVGLLVFAGCKTSDDPAQYTLTVTLDEGVLGTPAAGTFTYAENDVVNYNYSAQSGYGNLEVSLDNANIPASGTITMTGNHTLNVTSDFDIRGTWTGIFHAAPYNSFFTVTFSGSILTGTVQGKTQVVTGNGNGNFTVSDNQIDFTLQFYYVLLTFSGTIDNINQMSGTWGTSASKGISASLPKKLPSSGTWELER